MFIAIEHLRRVLNSPRKEPDCHQRQSIVQTIKYRFIECWVKYYRHIAYRRSLTRKKSRFEVRIKYILYRVTIDNKHSHDMVTKMSLMKIPNEQWASILWPVITIRPRWDRWAVSSVFRQKAVNGFSFSTNRVNASERNRKRIKTKKKWNKDAWT